MTRISGSYSAAMFDERVVRENEKIIAINQFFENGVINCFMTLNILFQIYLSNIFLKLD